MKVILHKQFRKNTEKLTSNQKKKVAEVLRLFRQNPHHPQLNNHALHGKDKTKRAISAGGDLRLVFEEENNYEIVMFVRVGTHNQVY